LSLTLTINGQAFQYPEPGDSNWGTQATLWASAVTTGMLQKAGGSFTLTAEVDFGSGFGLKSLYYKTRTANVASAGAFRLARTDVVSWRNEAGGADLNLSVDASNSILWDGVAFLTASNTATLTNKTIDGDDNTLLDIGITSLKTVLADADKVLRRDAAGGVVSGNALPNSSAIVTTDATQTLTNKTIAFSSITGTVPVNQGGTGQTTATAGFDALAPTTTTGDIIAFNGTDNVRLPVGTDTFVLSADSSQTTGLKWVSTSSSTATPTSLGLTTSYFATIQSAVLTSASTTINVTTTDGYQTVIATSTSNVTLNLPAAASNPGRVLTVIKTGNAGTVTLDPNSTEVIYTPSTPAGVATYPMIYQSEKVTLSCDGTGWFLINAIPVPMLSAYLTVAQSRADATQYNVEFDTFDVNVATQFATSTWTALRPGRYDVQSTITFSRTGAGSLAQSILEILVNGSVVRGTNWEFLGGTANILRTNPLSIGAVLNIATGDAVQIRVLAGSFTSTNYLVSGSRYSMLTITQID
jgi:hypothetical protein